MKYIDNPQSPIEAIKEGRLRVTNFQEFELFAESLKFTPEKVDRLNASWQQNYQGRQLNTADVLAAYFQAFPVLMEAPSDWNSLLLFNLLDPEQQKFYRYSIKVVNGVVSFELGLPAEAEPNCEISTDGSTFINLLRYAKEKGLNGESILDELSDAELELLAGGNCWLAGCGSDNCGAVACGTAGCGGVACGGVACGGDLCGLNACGGAACPADVCVVDADPFPVPVPGVCAVDVVPFIPFF